MGQRQPLFDFFQTQFLEKNCRLQRDSNSDRQTRRSTLTTWPSPRPQARPFRQDYWIQKWPRLTAVKSSILSRPMWPPDCFFLYGPFLVSFSFIFVFWIVNIEFPQYKIWWWRDSNWGPPKLEATLEQTESQPLPYLEIFAPCLHVDATSVTSCWNKK